ncbi:MAG: hypothetical protein HRT72_01655 [Flavobacteriales bacterium]|nr:hypothetical protein [Flavobacteriales bacterium]
MVNKEITVLLIFGACLANVESHGQNEFDVMRYSQQEIGGTSKFTSMAGAFGALGGDASTLSYNPAGIAIYRKSEFTFTPGYYQSDNSSSYNGSTTKRSIGSLNHGNLGTIFYNGEHTGRWMSINFGFSINRTASFRNKYVIQGTTNGSSLIDQYENEANSIGSDNINSLSSGALGAYNTYLLEIDTTNNSFYQPYRIDQGLQTKSNMSSGKMAEYAFSIGGNYNDRIFLGMTLVYNVVNYRSRIEYSETDENFNSEVNYFVQGEDLKTRGKGINIKIGVIYKANDWLRLGGALHTPTRIELQDDFEVSFETYYDGYSSASSVDSELWEFDYSIITPFKAIGSVATIFGKQGLLSADIEYIDYTLGILQSDSYSFIEENNNVQDYLKTAVNFRLGGEYRINNLSLRGGYANYGKPDNLNSGTITYTGGMGWRDETYFVDVAYANIQSKETHYLYNEVSSKATVNTTKHKATITLGLNF